LRWLKRTSLLLAERRIGSAILADEPKDIRAYLIAGRKALVDSTNALAAYQALPMSDEEKTLVAPVPGAIETYRAFFEQVAPHVVANIPTSKAQATELILHQAAAPAAVINEDMPVLIATNQQQAEDSLLESQAIFERAFRLLLTALVGGVVLAFGLGFFLARSISRRAAAVERTITSLADRCAASLAEGLEAMANNDLTLPAESVTPPLATYGKDELGQTAAATNRLRDKLLDTIASYERARQACKTSSGRSRRTPRASPTPQPN
jgi:methyl-accepting chemotaxis protein